MAIESHPNEETIERYCLGSLAGTELEDVEEHILVCTPCQDRIRLTDQYILIFRKAAAAEVRRGQTLRRAGWIALAAALAGIAGFAVMWLFGPAVRLRGRLPVAVALQATRGGDTALRARAPARTALQLNLDLTGVPPLPSYTVTLVDQHGRAMLKATAAPTAEKLSITLPASFIPGIYWVRLYEAPRMDQPLREFGLELEAER